jgi:hypothetical protein
LVAAADDDDAAAAAAASAGGRRPTENPLRRVTVTVTVSMTQY